MFIINNLSTTLNVTKTINRTGSTYIPTVEKFQSEVFKRSTGSISKPSLHPLIRISVKKLFRFLTSGSFSQKSHFFTLIIQITQWYTFNVTTRFRKAEMVWCGGARETHCAACHNGVSPCKTNEIFKSPRFFKS